MIKFSISYEYLEILQNIDKDILFDIGELSLANETWPCRKVWRSG